MNRHVKMPRIILTLIILTLVIAMVPASTFAATKAEGYEVVNYNQEVTVNKDHTYDVHTMLTVRLPANFSEFRMLLPSGHFVLTNVNVADKEFIVKADGSNRELQIMNLGGDRETTRVIDITYTIMEYAEHNDSNDMFYYDAVSPNWQVPISEIGITMHLPEDFDWSDLQYYAGQFGSQDVSDKLKLDVAGSTIRLTGERLPSNFGITFKAELPDGYWQETLDNSWARDISLFIAAIMLLIIGLFWLGGGRDPKFPRKNEYHPIDGLSPADVGYLLYGKMRIKDIIALIVYLAIKGSLRIVEYQPKKYKLVKLAEPKDEERYIRSVYYTLFDDVYDGRAIEMEDLGTKLIAISRNVESSIASGYSSKDMRACTTLSMILRFACIVLLSVQTFIIRILADVYVYKEISLQEPIVLMAAAAVALMVINWAYDNRFELESAIFKFTMGASALIYAVINGYVANIMAVNTGSPVLGFLILALNIASMVIVLFMKSRAVGNARLASRLYGLRHFMSRATAEDLAPLNKENPDYYYELLPYALLFSMAETWARKFRWIKAKSPFFFEEEMEGSAMSIPVSQKSTDTIARDLKTFSRTIESEFHTMIRKRR